MARATKEETEQKWRAQLVSWETSGLSLRAFASREGMWSCPVSVDTLLSSDRLSIPLASFIGLR
jgi:hypothetical protein